MTEYHRTIESKILPKALDQYSIQFKKFQFECEETNVFFKGYDIDNKVYGLKICQEESNKFEDNIGEVFFLSELTKRTNVLIPKVVFNKKGEGVTQVENSIFDTVKRCILYEWIEGKNYHENETLDSFYKLGVIIGQLHLASADISLPSNIKPKSWDKVFYFRDEAIVYKKGEYSNRLGKENIKLLDSAIEFVDSEMARMIQSNPLLLIHGDINPWNILITDTELAIIDFEEALLGYPIQDIAVVLYYYKYHEKYLEFKNALMRGYQSVNSTLGEVDDFHLDVLMTARRLNLINYVLYMQEDPWDYIDRSLQRVKAFSDKWIVKKSSTSNGIICV